MKKFLVVFSNGSEKVVEGLRIYSDSEYYYIDGGNNTEHLGEDYWEKSSVKCIIPLEPAY